MAAYVLGEIEVRDPTAYAQYGRQVPATIETPRPAPATAASAASAGAQAEVAARSALSEAGLPPAEAAQETPPVIAEERAREAGQGESQLGEPSTTSEPTTRGDEEASRPSPFFAGGSGGRRARAAATAHDSRDARGDMTPIAPAVIPLVPPPDDPGPNGGTAADNV